MLILASPVPPTIPRPSQAGAPVTLVSITLAANALVLIVGAADAPLPAAVAHYSDGTSAAVVPQWASGTPGVATIAGANAHALAAGTAVLTATYQTHAATCTATVSAAASGGGGSGGTSSGAHVLGFAAAAGNGAYVDLAAQLDPTSGTPTVQVPRVSRVTGFDPAAWQALGVAGNGSFPVRQFGEGGQHTSDVYGGCSSTAVNITAFLQSGLGAGKASLALSFPLSALPASGAWELREIYDAVALTARLVAVRTDTGAVLASDQTTITTAAWHNTTSGAPWGGRLYVGCVQASYGRAPARLGIFYDVTLTSALADTAAALPSGTPPAGVVPYDVRALSVDAAAGSRSIASLASGAPALVVTNGRVYDPVDAGDTAPVAIAGPAALALTVGFDSTCDVRVLNAWGAEIAGAPALTFDNPSLAHEVTP